MHQEEQVRPALARGATKKHPFPWEKKEKKKKQRGEPCKNFCITSLLLVTSAWKSKPAARAANSTPRVYSSEDAGNETSKWGDLWGLRPGGIAALANLASRTPRSHRSSPTSTTRSPQLLFGSALPQGLPNPPLPLAAPSPSNRPPSYKSGPSS